MPYVASVMSNIERIIGRFEQFMETSIENQKQNLDDHKMIMISLDSLKAFKFKVIGASAIISFLTTLLIRNIYRGS